MSDTTNRVVRFMEDLYRKTGGPEILEAMDRYHSIFENSFRPDLDKTLPASATRQTPAIDYKGFMHIVPHAHSGTNQPDVCPALNNVVINGTCTRDTGAETAAEKWKVPDFAKFTKGKVSDALMHGKTSSSLKVMDFNGYNKTVNAELMKNGRRNQVDRPGVCVASPNTPMRCGYTVTNQLSANGTDVGYADGGGTSNG